MKLNWFTRKGIVYMPVSKAGWLIIAASIVYAVYIFARISNRSHSLSNTSLNVVFNTLLIGMVYTVIAYFTERRSPPGKPRLPEKAV